MKLSRLERVLRLIALLQSSRYYSAETIAEKLEVSRRTVFRDLELLRTVGIVYYFDENKNGYAISSQSVLPPLNLSMMEALSLLMNSHHTRGGCMMPLKQVCHEAGVKIENALPPHVQHHCGVVLREVSIHCAPHVQGEEQQYSFALLQQAIRQRHNVQMTYRSFFEKEDIETTLSPYHLRFDSRAWYVIGLSTYHNQIRTFKLSRIKKIKTLLSRYILEKSFQINDYLDGAWGLIPEGKMYDVKLRFSPKVALNVAEVEWHAEQALTLQDDGSLLYEVTVNGIGEIMWWILGYADQVEVLEPLELRHRVQEKVKNMAAVYSDSVLEDEKAG